MSPIESDLFGGFGPAPLCYVRVSWESVAGERYFIMVQGEDYHALRVNEHLLISGDHPLFDELLMVRQCGNPVVFDDLSYSKIILLWDVRKVPSIYGFEPRIVDAVNIESCY
jgi:hypothetical protein